MDLTSGMPFWLIRNGFLHAYSRLENNINCDVLIIGSGITGSLAAHYICSENIDCVVVDKRNTGMGSTIASTALLQYETDIHLYDLILRMGQHKAVQAYKLCLESIRTLESLINDLKIDCGYEKSSSLYCASSKRDIRKLQKEFDTRRQYGLPAEWLDKKDMEEMFSVLKPAAIYNNASAKVDPFRLSQGLLYHNHLEKSLPVYMHTEIKRIKASGKKFICLTQDGKSISCNKIIMASGYEASQFTKKGITQMHSTYAIISEPIPKEKFWKEEAMIWETARPYTYIRTTENRIIAGGEDVPFKNPAHRDRLLKAKSKKLEKKFKNFLPDIPFHTDFYWCGTFAETPDGLPYIGKQPGISNVYYAMGYGGNGIVFSVLAAEIILREILQKPLSYADIFSFKRVINSAK